MRTTIIGLVLVALISTTGCMQAAATCEASCDREQANGCGNTACVDNCRATLETAARTGCSSQAQAVVTCNFDHPCNSGACSAPVAVLLACGGDYCMRNPGDPACPTP